MKKQIVCIILLSFIISIHPVKAEMGSSNFSIKGDSIGMEGVTDASVSKNNNKAGDFVNILLGRKNKTGDRDASGGWKTKIIQAIMVVLIFVILGLAYYKIYLRPKWGNPDRAKVK